MTEIEDATTNALLAEVAAKMERLAGHKESDERQLV
jgi:hypothetical protein